MGTTPLEAREGLYLHRAAHAGIVVARCSLTCAVVKNLYSWPRPGVIVWYKADQ